VGGVVGGEGDVVVVVAVLDLGGDFHLWALVKVMVGIA
jgi:hypothetical protein